MLHGDDFRINALTFGERDDFGTGSEIGIAGKLVADGAIGHAGIVVVDVNQMQQYSGALNVAQEVVTKALAIGGAFNETGNVRNQ